MGNQWGNAKPGQLCGFDADGNPVGVYTPQPNGRTDCGQRLRIEYAGPDRYDVIDGEVVAWQPTVAKQPGGGYMSVPGVVLRVGDSIHVLPLAVPYNNQPRVTVLP